MTKADTPFARPGDSTGLPETSPTMEGPPAVGEQEASETKGVCAVPGSVATTARPMRPLLYSMTEVAEMFGRRPRTIRHWIAQGHLTRSKVGNAVFISEHDIEALMSPAVTVVRRNT